MWVMDQEKFGKFIKEIRKKNNLTQKQLAEKYNVTYQAVSKWENGLNMPDKLLIKQMSEDFGVSLEELFDGEFKKEDNKKNINKILLLFLGVVLIILVVVLFNLNKDVDFKFKTLSSSCDNFNISGNIAYNDLKSSIYITNIEYCGGEDTTLYNEIECVLYEMHEDMVVKISSYSYNEEENISLEDFLEMVTITVDDYKKNCSEYTENSLYLSVNAKDDNKKITTYNIPLSLEQSCFN